MSVDIERLAGRADELVQLAKAAGLNSIDQELALLPEGDAGAKIGYLANALGIDLGVACDVSAPAEGSAV